MSGQARCGGPKGRGAEGNPANRFESAEVVADWDHLGPDDEPPFEPRPETRFLPDRTRSIIASNDSPDIPFQYSINPYRGCEHGCAYCYARPSHEYLGMSAGLDFETRILVKHQAPELLRRQLAHPRWQGQVLALSGVTDPYQPAERRFRLTRGLLEVCWEFRQALVIVTKNALVVRDLDLLKRLAAERLVHVRVSVTTLDASLARVLEPRTSHPAARLRAIEHLARAGVPVGAMVAPIIPGLNDEEIPRVLEAVARAGAGHAAWVLLRLPWAVEEIFLQWLDRHAPQRKERVLAWIKETRGGQLSEHRFGLRMRGSGPLAEHIARTFAVFARRYGLDRGLPPLDTSRFRRVVDQHGQRLLFDPAAASARENHSGR